MQLSRSLILEVHLVPHGRAIQYGTERPVWECPLPPRLAGGEAEMLQTVLTLPTHCGHKRGRNTATQQSPAVRGVLSFQWEDERRLQRLPRFRQFRSGRKTRPCRQDDRLTIAIDIFAVVGGHRKGFYACETCSGEDVMADDEGVRRRDVLKGLGVTGAVAGLVATTAPPAVEEAKAQPAAPHVHA